MNQTTSSSNRKTIRHIALGGTFDHFHRGHRLFIQKALRLSLKVTIGITVDELAHKLHGNDVLENYHLRQRSVKRFVSKNRSEKQRVAIIPLHDKFGPSISDRTLEALLVTQDTLKAANQANHIRKQKGLPFIKLIRFPLLQAEDGNSIASHRIRKGEITREGIHFASRLKQSTPLSLSSKLRPEFRKPFGEVFSPETGVNDVMNTIKQKIEDKNLKPVVCVGDIVTQSYLKVGGRPHLKIIDFHVQRKQRFNQLSQLGPIEHLQQYNVSNPAGRITNNLVKTIQKSLKSKKPSIIKIKGEEDLAVLPVVLLAPLGAVVLYGHYLLGVVLVEITETKKAEGFNLMEKLKKSTNNP